MDNHNFNDSDFYYYSNKSNNSITNEFPYNHHRRNQSDLNNIAHYHNQMSENNSETNHSPYNHHRRNFIYF